MSSSIISYLSLTKDEETDNITLDDDRLRSIRTRYDNLYSQSNAELTDDQRKEETLKKLLKELKLKDDQLNNDYLNICVTERTEDDVKFELNNKFSGPVKNLYDTANEPVIFQSENGELDQKSNKRSKKSPTTKATKKSKKNIVANNEDEECKDIDQLTCVIYKNLESIEIQDFMKTFLFRRVQGDDGQALKPSVPLEDESLLTEGNLRALPRGTILDVFIRQQLTERDVITFKRARSKFRLVEPVSLTDDFDSWTFDHFQQIFDVWITIDPNEDNKTDFPKRWKIHENTTLNYIIGGISDQTTARIQRPSTKSLENFIRDVCTIEDNGMFEEWFEALTDNEDITTYAHLSNLTTPEWEKIRDLSMNALKTIKFYVDQEKNLAAAQSKTTKNKGKKEKNDQLSHCELLAKLHMIKLYLIYQIENENGIETIPHLDAECVENAFEEMRTEGYADDGLFDDMKLFFQPLTITDEELNISPNELSNANKDQQKQIKKITKSIDELNDEYNHLYEDYEKLNKEMTRVINERNKEFEDHQLLMQGNLSYQERTRLNLQWSSQADEKKGQIDAYKQRIAPIKHKLQEIDQARIEKQNLRETIETQLANKKTRIDRNIIKLHRGFIVYGPPGTGKSDLMGKLAKKIGIAMLAPPLASGNLERSLVGQSEAVITSLCRRARRLPHLICCLSIDEIDSLAPRRDEKSSEGKVSKISVLLSVLEGAENVPNLMFFSATNLLHRMDEAFLRRMSGKFFVGRPSSASRKSLLEKLPQTMFQPKVLDKLVIATTNFSGSAITRLKSEITTHHRCQRRTDSDYEVTEEDALILADRTARHYQLYLGLDTLPRLQLQNLFDRKKLSKNRTRSRTKDDDLQALHLSKPKDFTFTGKIVISLTDRCVRIETINQSNQQYSIVEDEFRETEQNLQQLLERITAYGTDRNVQLLQLVDLNLLSSKGAYDEQKVSEILKECYDECTAYKRSMIVYDLDSLIGVNKSESDSSMGTSTSSSVVNQRIYVYVTNRFQEAKIESSNPDEKSRIERWAIAIVRDSFLLNKFTSDVGFTPTDKQRDEEDKEHRKSTEVIACVKCHESYTENENKLGVCTHHDGFVYDNLSFSLEKYRLSYAIAVLNNEEFLASKDASKKDELERGKTRMKLICCGAVVQTGGNIGGCKKTKHGFVYRRRRKHNRDILLKEDIEAWETECFENIYYNDKHQDIIKNRPQFAFV